MLRYLHQYAVPVACAGQVRPSGIFAPGHGFETAVQFAITCIGTKIGQPAPGAPQRAAAQFRGRGCIGFGKRGRGGIAQTGQPKAGAQQVVITTVFSAALMAEWGSSHRL